MLFFTQELRKQNAVKQHTKIQIHCRLFNLDWVSISFYGFQILETSSDMQKIKKITYCVFLVNIFIFCAMTSFDCKWTMRHARYSNPILKWHLQIGKPLWNVVLCLIQKSFCANFYFISKRGYADRVDICSPTFMMFACAKCLFHKRARMKSAVAYNLQYFVTLSQCVITNKFVHFLTNAVLVRTVLGRKTTGRKKWISC